MESIYVQPPMFKLNEKTGRYKVTKVVTPEDIFNMTKYLLTPSMVRKTIRNVECVRDFLATELATEDREVFACLFLDVKHTIIRFEKLFYGTINSASVYPRVVVKRALLLNAAAVICAHNHPSTDTTPSQADINITEQITKALQLIDIKLLDHFIVGGTHILSMQEWGRGR